MMKQGKERQKDILKVLKDHRRWSGDRRLTSSQGDQGQLRPELAALAVHCALSHWRKKRNPAEFGVQRYSSRDPERLTEDHQRRPCLDDGVEVVDMYGIGVSALRGHDLTDTSTNTKHRGEHGLRERKKGCRALELSLWWRKLCRVSPPRCNFRSRAIAGHGGGID